MWKTTSSSRTFKILGKAFRDLNPEASKKVDEAFKAADEAFKKADEAADKASEAADTIFSSFSSDGDGFDCNGNMQTEHMNIKVKEKSAVINGDVTEIILNGKKVYPA